MEICKDRGLDDISSLAECSGSTELFQAYYPSLHFISMVATPSFPKGCYAYLTEDLHYGIYFNAHSSGAGKSSARVLCKYNEGRESKMIVDILLYTHTNVYATTMK